MLHIPSVLPADKVHALRQHLLAANWQDGRATAGHMSAAVKKNRQLAEDDPAGLDAAAEILAALSRSPAFASAALAARISPPLFNRYETGEGYGDHIDGALRPHGNGMLRTDLAATLFLSAPEEYEGGELVVRGLEGEHAVKLPAGDLFLYPSSSIHHVAPVRSGQRLASFFWIESLVRRHEDRSLLCELDQSIHALKECDRDDVRLALTGIYHNLLRRWARD